MWTPVHPAILNISSINVFIGLSLLFYLLIFPSIMLVMKGLRLIRCPISFPLFDLIVHDNILFFIFIFPLLLNCFYLVLLRIIFADVKFFFYGLIKFSTVNFFSRTLTIQWTWWDSFILSINISSIPVFSVCRSSFLVHFPYNILNVPIKSLGVSIRYLGITYIK